ncbi:hypothetical protein E4U53_003137, partial [Claviceps sorghi]
ELEDCVETRDSKDVALGVPSHSPEQEHGMDGSFWGFRSFGRRGTRCDWVISDEGDGRLRGSTVSEGPAARKAVAFNVGIETEGGEDAVGRVGRLGTGKGRRPGHEVETRPDIKLDRCKSAAAWWTLRTVHGALCTVHCLVWSGRLVSCRVVSCRVEATRPPSSCVLHVAT